MAPFAGMLGDRYPRERVLLVTNVARVVLVGAAAVAVFADADPWIVYGLVDRRDDRDNAVPLVAGGANTQPRATVRQS